VNAVDSSAWLEYLVDSDRGALADSIIYATTQRYNAILWTQDEHFQDLPRVKFFPKH
jgi:predicted nucleic acid-binding protein